MLNVPLVVKRRFSHGQRETVGRPVVAKRFSVPLTINGGG